MLCTQMKNNNVVIMVIKILFAWKGGDFLVFGYDLLRTVRK